MHIISHPKASDRSSYYVTVEFYDENGAAVAPLSATWTLVDGNYAIVNLREDVVIDGVIGTTHSIALSGADLAAGSTRAEQTRFITVEAVYTSPTTGTSMPLVSSAKFMITDLPAI